ncbi:MAG TPA: FtsX-like permease family protein [Dysgonamonadaceae bacterium]|nr:FtsX-like permease family protein [Dysgonamonadaceae bacterium]
MLLHHLKIAWRNLLKQRTQTIITVMGLAIGFTAFAFTLSWIRYERGFDQHIPDADRIYKVLKVDERNEVGVKHILPTPMQMFLQKCPEVEVVTGIRQVWHDYEKDGDILIKNGSMMLADTSFFKVFYPDRHIRYPVELSEKSMILSEKAALKLGVSQADIGHHVDLLGFTLLDIVSGLPERHSNVPFDMMTVKLPEVDRDCPWCYFSHSVYIRVHEHADIASLSAKLDSLEVEGSMQGMMSFILVPLRELHYTYPEEKAKIKYNHLKIFGSVSLLVIICALLNYLMLFVNNIKTRSRELALRKVNGASYRKLLSLLLTETGLILLLSLFIGVVLSEILYTPFIQLAEIESLKSFFLFEMIIYGIFIFLLTLFIIFIPVYLLIKKNIAEVITPQLKTAGQMKIGFTQITLFLQLSVGILLSFCTILFFIQLNNLNRDEIGFDRFNVNSFSSNVSLTKGEINKIAGVEDVIFFDGQFLPRTVSSSFKSTTEEDVVEGEMFRFHEPDFIDFFDIQILEGRNFHYGETTACLINETAKKRFGFDDPMGEIVNNFTVIGVIQDLYIDSPMLPVLPSVYLLRDNMSEEARIDRETGKWEYINEAIPSNEKESLSKTHNSFAYKYSEGSREMTEQTIANIVADQGGRLSKINNMEDVYADYTESERYLIIMLSIMTGVAILIAFFGIYTMTTLACTRRRKEIAIRKVNGAAIREIFALFFGSYFRITVLASIVAFPVGVLIMQRWLEQYSRRVSMEWWLFVGLFLLVLLFVTVSMIFRVYSAASENPAEVVKSE